MVDPAVKLSSRGTNSDETRQERPVLSLIHLGAFHSLYFFCIKTFLFSYHAWIQDLKINFLLIYNRNDKQILPFIQTL